VSNLVSLILAFTVLGGLAAAAIFLRSYRDRLTRHFGQGPMKVKGSLHLGDGSRLVLVDVEGTMMACGVGRNGVGASTIIRPKGNEMLGK
jgi:flagellar biogenesis protein FliO